MTDSLSFNRVLATVAAFVAALWVLQLTMVAGGLSTAQLALWPREPSGLSGVITAPLVHGSWRHLFANSMPLLVLATAALYSFPRAARLAVPMIWVSSGLAVWLLAREGPHLGISGISYGLLFFILVIGFLRRDRASLAIVLVTVLIYGGMVWGVLPQGPGISFEYHLAGALGGGCCAVLLRRRDPMPPPRRYAWEPDETAPLGAAHGRAEAQSDGDDARWPEYVATVERGPAGDGVASETGRGVGDGSSHPARGPRR